MAVGVAGVADYVRPCPSRSRPSCLAVPAVVSRQCSWSRTLAAPAPRRPDPGKTTSWPSPASAAGRAGRRTSLGKATRPHIRKWDCGSLGMNAGPTDRPTNFAVSGATSNQRGSRRCSVARLEPLAVIVGLRGTSRIADRLRGTSWDVAGLRGWHRETSWDFEDIV